MKHPKCEVYLDQDAAVHDLKTLEPHFTSVLKGNKTAEIRINDRDFKVDDEIVLWQWSIDNGYTGNYITVVITDILEKFEGIKKGHAMLSFRKVNQGSDKQWNAETQAREINVNES